MISTSCFTVAAAALRSMPGFMLRNIKSMLRCSIAGSAVAAMAVSALFSQSGYQCSRACSLIV